MHSLNHNDIIETLNSKGFSTYLVGGAVRDIFTGNTPHDFDIVTQATPTQIQEVFQGFVVNTVGKSFGVTLVEGFEVATFRVDAFPEGYGAKNCKPVFADSIHSDVSRRDLSVNALALCTITGDLIDNHNGLNDLREGTIRFVGNADQRIAEDPNRIIRACRFLAKLNGTFATDTLEALRRNVHLVKTHVDVERISIEILKAMEVPQPSLFFSALHLIGALEIIFPGFEKSINHTHGLYHKENVWEHMMLAGDKVSAKFPLVRLAAFLHDVGKPMSFAHNNDNTFVGHEVSGADVVNKWLTDLRFSNEARLFVVGLVRSHMWGGSNDMSPKAMRRLLFRLNELGVDSRSWLRLRIADRSANLLKNPFTFTDISERMFKVGIFNGYGVVSTFSVNSLVLKGGELIKRFMLIPGPIVSSLQKHLLEFVIENGFEYNTEEALHEEALKFLNA